MWNIDAAMPKIIFDTRSVFLSITHTFTYNICMMMQQPPPAVVLFREHKDNVVVHKDFVCFCFYCLSWPLSSPRCLAQDHDDERSRVSLSLSHFLMRIPTH